MLQFQPKLICIISYINTCSRWGTMPQSYLFDHVFVYINISLLSVVIFPLSTSSELKMSQYNIFQQMHINSPFSVLFQHIYLSMIYKPVNFSEFTFSDLFQNTSQPAAWTSWTDQFMDQWHSIHSSACQLFTPICYLFLYTVTLQIITHLPLSRGVLQEWS